MRIVAIRPSFFSAHCRFVGVDVYAVVVDRVLSGVRRTINFSIFFVVIID